MYIYINVNDSCMTILTVVGVEQRESSAIELSQSVREGGEGGRREGGREGRRGRERERQG